MSFKKMWRYLLALLLLGVVGVCCDSDFNIENPLGGFGSESDSVMLTDTLLEYDDSVGVEIDPNEYQLEDSIEVEDQPEDISVESSESYSSGIEMWRVVIASDRNEARAQRFAQRANDPEIDVIYVEELSTYRVVYRSFESLNQAQESLIQAQYNHPKAWLIKF